MRRDDATLDLFASEPAPGAESADGTPERTEPAAGAAQTARTDAAGEGASAEAAGRATEAPAPDLADTARAPRVPPRDEVQVWTVSQVNRAVRQLLEGQLVPLWIGGEVANWKRYRSGHRYFTLKDDRAQLRAVMWRADAARLPIDPDDGMEVRVWGSLTLYEARGEYQFVARRLEAAGSEGLWRIAFEKLRTRLEAEGLLAAERKRPLPRFPRTVGVVTSTGGAALRDILSVIGRRAPWTRVVVAGARVQGDGAALEIAEALHAVTRSADLDVVIVGRGGGSIEDLWAFNEESVARAIAASPVPVISAVGHETDITIADLVADYRAPTPSAAGEAAVPDGAAVTAYLGEVPGRLTGGLRNAVAIRRRRVHEGVPRLERAMQRLVGPRRDRVERQREALLRTVRQVVERRRQRAAVGDRLARAIDVGLDRRRQRLATLAGRLHALSPLSTLERGYAVPLSPDGAVLRSVAAFTPGRPFVLRVADGRIDSEVQAVRPDDPDLALPGAAKDPA